MFTALFAPFCVFSLIFVFCVCTFLFVFVLLLTLDIAYACKKFDDSSFSYSYFRALKFKVDYVRLPCAFQEQFVYELHGVHRA